MKIAQLKSLSPIASVRGTEHQDTVIATAALPWHKRRWVRASAVGATVGVLLIAWLIHAWSNSNHVIAADRLRIVSVVSGHFVRDVAAQGTVIAAINPTLFSVAPG